MMLSPQKRTQFGEHHLFLQSCFQFYLFVKRGLSLENILVFLLKSCFQFYLFVKRQPRRDDILDSNFHFSLFGFSHFYFSIFTFGFCLLIFTVLSSKPPICDDQETFSLLYISSVFFVFPHHLSHQVLHFHFC